MVPISVVMITKNKADVIARSLYKARMITNDIVVIDNGSTDDTLKIAKEAGCRIYHKKWDGYAANKNKGIELAEHDWILSVDADEVPDDTLMNELKNLDLHDTKVVYDIKFRSYFGDRQIRFGKWGGDHHIRLFNRQHVKWSDSPVHETLAIPTMVTRKKIQGYLHHYSVKDAADLNNKLSNYARLCAQKYYDDGKRASFTKLYLSPIFGFIKNYIFFWGFLDGAAGFEIAAQTLKHTRFKYTMLQKMEQQNAADSKPMFIEEPVFADY
jgi:glycosyltransferase involved in cell wall biosynthesis